MEATFKINMLDTFNIQQGDHFNSMVNEYSTISKAVNPDNDKDGKSTTHFEYIEGVQRKYYGLVEALSNSGLLKDNMKIVDLGCGLCTTLYNIMGQFKSYKIPVKFYGIEHNEELLNSFVKYLSRYEKGVFRVDFGLIFFPVHLPCFSVVCFGYVYVCIVYFSVFV